MNESQLRDLERRLSASLHAAAPRPASDLPDRLLRRTAVVQQRRGFFGMSFTAALAAAVVLALAVALGLGIGYLIPRSGFVGGPSQSPAPSSPPASQSPSAVPTATAEPTESPPPSPSAPVFEDGNRCTNEEDGYTVAYPADWWANEAQDFADPAFTDIPACFAFAPDAVEIRPNSELSSEVAIVFSEADQILPPSTGATVVDSRETTVDGRPALVREDEEGDSGAPFSFPGQLRYSYFIELPSGDYLVVGTSSNELNDPEYETQKEILDRMMATLHLTR